MKKFYLTDILNIATPIILGNLSFILIGVGDIIIAGRHSTETLAAVSISNAIIMSISMFGIGTLGSISALLSNYRGSKQEPEKYFYPSIKITAILSFIISTIILAIIPFIDKMGFDPNIIKPIKEYFFISVFSIFGAYLHCTLKEFLQTFEIVLFPNLLSVFSIFLNIILNIIFVFGFGLIPEMGVKGLAIVSLITRYFMGLVLLFYCYKKFNIGYHKDFKYYTDLLKIGIPSSVAMIIEFLGFNITIVILARISSLYAAAQNIIFTLTSVAYMIPLGISAATSIKVGYTNGAKKFKSLKKYAYTGLLSSIFVMVISALMLAIFPKQILCIFTNDFNLINACLPVLLYLCFFQVFDGMQVALSGIFRGLKNTKIVMMANFISYWLISIPVGCYLGITKKMGLLGFWYGLFISSVVLCIILIINLKNHFNKMGN